MRNFGLILVTCLVIGLTGCGGTIVITSTSDGQDGTIQIPSDQTGAASPTEPTTSTTSEESAALPQPEAATAPPTSPTTAEQVPEDVDVQGALDELKNTYGIRVKGNYTPTAVRNCLIVARQLHPEDTKNCTVDFSDKDGGAVQGSWQRDGTILIMGPAKESLWNLFHEMSHHCTLYQEETTGDINSTPRKNGRRAANEVVKALDCGSDPKNFPPSVITRSYAQKNIREFWAELFSNYRIRKESLVPSAGFSGQFNPPESLRPTIEQMYAPATTGATADAGTQAGA